MDESVKLDPSEFDDVVATTFESSEFESSELELSELESLELESLELELSELELSEFDSFCGSTPSYLPEHHQKVQNHNDTMSTHP